MDIHSVNRYFAQLDARAGDDVATYRKEHFPNYPHFGRSFDPFSKRDRKTVRKLFDAELEGHDFHPVMSSLVSHRKYYRRSDAIPRGYKWKDRPVKMASHRDRLLYGVWNHELSALHKAWVTERGLFDNVVAYLPNRAASNIEAAKHAFDYLHGQADWHVACLDVTGFFDNLNHRHLRRMLEKLLGVEELPAIHNRLFRAATRYSEVKRLSLERGPAAQKLIDNNLRQLARDDGRLRKKLAAARLIRPNRKGKGIPQGLPCSGVLSNVYMIEFDETMVGAAAEVGGLYMRYADDLFLACPSADDVRTLEALVRQEFDGALQLEAKESKTERFAKANPEQNRVSYLGIDYRDGVIHLRESTVLRFERKLSRYIKSYVFSTMAREHVEPSLKKLRAKYGHTGSRNFYSYARRVKEAFDSDAEQRYDTTPVLHRLKGVLPQIEGQYQAAVKTYTDRTERRMLLAST